MPHDNVIIFGAGASLDGGIPLLRNFVEQMWGYAVRGKGPRGPLSTGERELLTSAHNICVDLESYSSRANFDTRNIEDVLGLLSFEAVNGGAAVERYKTWIKAITTTIEIAALHPYREEENPERAYQNSFYHTFWRQILRPDRHENPPAIITFNYDLVLERALFHCFHYFDTQQLKPPPCCGLRYFFTPYDFTITAAPYAYSVPGQGRRDGQKPLIKFGSGAGLEIPYLKLHGSLNWSESAAGKTPPLVVPSPPTKAIDTPLILPPVFNKTNSNVESVWKHALQVLREAKHIIIVGYSLPRTDIYMQYFLKSAVGPNSDLQRIIVFDPTLFRNDQSTREMTKRFQECFSPQFSPRITFRPDAEGLTPQLHGTFQHFLRELGRDANPLLFIR